MIILVMLFGLWYLVMGGAFVAYGLIQLEALKTIDPTIQIPSFWHDVLMTIVWPYLVFKMIKVLVESGAYRKG